MEADVPYFLQPRREPLNRFGWYLEESRSPDENLMDLAYLLARNSEAKDGHMGCCIARDDEVLVESCNAPLFGEARSDVHAEASAICDAARRGVRLEGASLYVTRAPCSRCYRLIAFAGIAKIVAPNAMDDKEARSSRALGIDYRVLKDDEVRAAWRRNLAEQYRDDDAIRRGRARRKLLKQQKHYGRIAPLFAAPDNERRAFSPPPPKDVEATEYSPSSAGGTKADARIDKAELGSTLEEDVA
ncbi:hypothetical protein CTAYLR_002475 [Chrysophaeum taylorii]|uniref:dCMP deaminase n=1 Tax=Chrysophaeum taylorii TaxID=2483200 RepID=A0AAD7XR05_9STRA|nr:hypothetical protein CTAYLR_002475 [Chrysophaeum taylorii]